MRQPLFFLIIFLFFAGQVHGQKKGQALIDSLLQEIPKAAEDTNKVNLLDKISFMYAESSPTDGVKYGQQGLDLAEKLKWQRGIALSNKVLGNNFLPQADYPKAVDYFLKSLKIFESLGDKIWTAKLERNIGLTFQKQGNYSQSLEYCSRALKIFEELGDKTWVRNTLVVFGMVYQAQNNYPKAEEYYTKIIKLAEEQGDKLGVEVNVRNIGLAYQAQKNYPSALECYFKALKIAEELVDRNGTADILNDLGSINLIQKKYSKALEYFSKSQKMFEELNDKSGIALSTANIGSAYSGQSNNTKALEYHLKALKIYEETAFKIGTAFDLDAIGTDYQYLHNYPRALEYYEKALKINEETGEKKGIATNQTNIGAVYDKKVDYPKALECYFKAVNLYEELGDKNNLAETFMKIAIIYFKQNDNKSASEFETKATKLLEQLDDKINIANSMEAMATAFLKQNNAPKSLEYYFKALKFAEESGDKDQISENLLWLAQFYNGQGNYTKALDYFQKSLKSNPDTGARWLTAGILSDMGNNYRYLGNYTAALDNMQKGLKMYEETGAQDGVGRNLMLIGKLYAVQDSFKKALGYYYKALKILEEQGCNECMTDDLGYIGAMYLAIAKDTTETFRHLTVCDSLLPETKAGTLKKAIEYLSRAVVLGNSIRYITQLPLIGSNLSEAQELTGDYKNALQSLKMSIKANDSLFSRESEIKIAKLEAKRDEEINEKKIEVQRIQLRNERIYYISGLGFLVLVSGGLFRSFKVSQKNKKTLEHKNKLIAIEKENADKQRIRAENSERFKQQFLANMSHEIRTPMNAVLGMTNLVLDTEVTQKQSKYLNAVKKSSENLLVIINDILDLSKLEAGKMEMEKIPFSLNEQIGQVYDTLQFKAEEKGLLLQTDIAGDVPQVLIGDPSRLNQVLINLCSNAIKFTDRGTVKVIVENAHKIIPSTPLNKTGEVSLLFRVIDSGIGIPADRIGRLFETFTQVDATVSRKYGGTGLGLSISKTLVEQQGGKMTATSQAGVGSEFSFIIPYIIADEAAIASLARESRVDHSLLQGIKILVAEDNEYNQVVIKDTLQNLIRDVKVDVAENGKLAIELLEAGDYDVILMDAQMPVLNGLEASEYIRKNMEGAKKNVPIIALTASVLNTDLYRCTEAGMNDYIPKPFTRAQLLNTLAKYYRKELGMVTPEFTSLYQPAANIEPNFGDAKAKITDLTFLKDFCAGDVTQMRKYIDIYLRLTPGNLQKIDNALIQNDFLSLARTVHGMKANLNYMGMKKTRQLTDEIEQVATQNNNPRELSRLISQLHHDFKQSLEELT